MSRDAFGAPKIGRGGRKYGAERLSARRGEDVAVPIGVMAFDPALGDCPVDPTLEIAVPNLKKLVPPKNAGNGDLIPRKNREDLMGGTVTVGF